MRVFGVRLLMIHLSVVETGIHCKSLFMNLSCLSLHQLWLGKWPNQFQTMYVLKCTCSYTKQLSTLYKKLVISSNCENCFEIITSTLLSGNNCLHYIKDGPTADAREWPNPLLLQNCAIGVIYFPCLLKHKYLYLIAFTHLCCYTFQASFDLFWRIYF